MNWNLSLIFPTKEDFEKELLLVDEDIQKLVSLKGKLKEKESFIKYMDYDREAELRIDRLYVYASMNNDQNQKNVDTQKALAKVRSKANELFSAVSFVSPELLSIDKDLLLSYCQKGYEGYKVVIEKLFHNNAYVLDEKGEGMLSNFQEVLQGYSQLYADLTIVDNVDQEVTLSDGNTITVSKANMTYYLEQAQKQEDRKKIFEAVYKSYMDHKSTLASIYRGVMNAEAAEANARGYDSILESHLYGNNIDKKVYLSLIDTVKKNTAPLKRYIALRKKYFNLEEYHTYDRFLTFAKSTKEYDFQTARSMVLEALEFMGEDFLNRAKLCMSSGRVDVLPQDGKRSGAYSTGTYTNGPFILLNHTGSLDSAFTLAHECGHSIHTTYSNENQPIETASYTIFVAEVASTFNEARFLDYMMEKTKDKEEKLVLLQKAIDNIVATFYRQTLFADYEYQAHKMIEDKEPVDATALSSIMKNLYMEYYGIDLKNEPYKDLVWAYIPHHFYSPFYVYQYATSYSASQAIYQDVKNGLPGAKERYIHLLTLGGSLYPVDCLKEAGVDLTTSRPFEAVANRFNELVDELESLLQ